MGLTPRQREVLKALHSGRKPAEIAQTMKVEQTTVREHIKQIKRFYGVRGYGATAYQKAVKEAGRRGDL